MNRSPKTPGPDHPIALMRRAQRVVVKAGGRTIADSVDTMILVEAGYPPVHYFPPADVNLAAISESEQTTFCPYKGEASYFHLGHGRANAVWSYRQPYASVEPIAGKMAFVPDLVDSIEVFPSASTGEAIRPD
jgi:uncharacterized protein (DUF427 family)